jgi:hypothetical protein
MCVLCMCFGLILYYPFIPHVSFVFSHINYMLFLVFRLPLQNLPPRPNPQAEMLASMNPEQREAYLLEQAKVYLYLVYATYRNVPSTYVVHNACVCEVPKKKSPCPNITCVPHYIIIPILNCVIIFISNCKLKDHEDAKTRHVLKTTGLFRAPGGNPLKSGRGAARRTSSLN